MLSYKEYLTESFISELIMTESFEPVKVNYGKDENFNGDFEINKNLIITYFKHKNIFIKVILGKSPEGYLLKFSSAKNMEDEFEYSMAYSEDSSLSIFNKVIYVTLKCADEYNINKIVFEPHPKNTRLTPFYNKIMLNKNFEKMLNRNGFKFSDEKETDIHMIERI